MFKKVLITEDLDSINNGVKAALKELGIVHFDGVKYCDDALLKIRKAQLDNFQYDLLICDLSFKKDYRHQELASGEDLIAVIREQFPAIKIIVFSVEDKKYTIQKLCNNYHINGYVWKGREGIKELKKAIMQVANTGAFYISSGVSSALRTKNHIEITDFDVFLIKSLSKGYLQEEISCQLKENGIKPSSVSAVEKRLKFLKEHFNANNPAHLVAIAKDFGMV